MSVPPASKRQACLVRPLSGIVVVDLGHYIAGPLAGRLLADQGAEVVKIDPPGGPRWHSDANKTLNHGKRMMNIDLKTPEGLQQIRQLLARADVVIENFRPGVMASLGLDFKELRHAWPRLVTVSLPGFASDDAEHAGLKAYEAVIAAVTGIFTDMGLDRTLEGYSPCYSALPQASVYAAVMASISVVTALVARHDTGLGDQIEVPLASALLDSLCFNAMGIDLPKRYLSNRALEIRRRKKLGLPFDLTREEVLDLQESFFRLYECGDGNSIYIVTMGHFGHVHRFLSALGLEEAAQRICASGNLYDSSTWQSFSEPTQSKCMLEMMYLREPFSSKIRELITSKLLESSAEDWARKLGDEARIPCSVVYSTKEWMHSEHALKSGLVEKSEGELRIGPLVWEEEEEAIPGPLPSDRAEAESTPPSELFCGPREPWLQGLKVLDLCNVIAGPMVSATLARFGADVIKIDHPKPLYDPRITVQFGLLTNRSKRTVLADLKKEGGQIVLAQLIKWADVIVFNGTKQQLAPLGIDPATVRRLNPRAVFCLLDAFGGPREGPWSERIGYDDILQAALGIMHRFGEPGSPTEHAHIGTIDVVCGWGGAFACVCALLKRRRFGVGSFCRTSLAAAGQYLQVPFLHDFPGRVFNEPRGKVRGAHALHTCIECSDGWLFVAATGAFPRPLELSEALEKLRVAGIGDLPDFCQRRTKADVRGTLQAQGIPAAPLSSLEAWRLRKEECSSYGFEHHPDHPCGLELVHPKPCAVRAIAPQPFLGTSRKLGADTREVVVEVRLGQYLQKWLAEGSVSDSIAAEFLPV